MFRVITGLAISCGITFGLFVLMAYLVETDGQIGSEELDEPLVVVIADIRTETDPEDRVRTPPEPPKLEQVPELSEVETKVVNTPIQQVIDIQPEPFKPGIGGGHPFPPPQSRPDGDAVPVFTISPQYPTQQARMGQEGWVKVAFDINPDGTVSNAKVIDAEPRRVFDKAALRAIRKWKFKPKMVDGRAQVQTNKTYVIDFNLES